MKKIIAGLGSFLLAGQVFAATVTIDGIDNIGGIDGTARTYVSDGETYMNLATPYEVFLKSGLADPQSDNGGEELIYLGAHTGVGTAAGAGTISVNIASQNDQPAGPVSLVLSASSATIWDFSVDLDDIQINNIFVVASALDQTLKFGDTSIDLGLGDIDSHMGIYIERLDGQTCGYEYPSVGGGCNTNDILGLEGSEENILDDYLTGLQVTDFAGTYFVEAFNVSVNSVVIPLPAGIFLYSSALAAGAVLRRKS